MNFILRLSLLICIIQLSACMDENNYAPVAELSAIEPLPSTGYYRAQPGNTLYQVAWRYGLDYRELAQYNAIEPPYTILPGQLLALRPKLSSQTASLPPVSQVPTYSNDAVVVVKKWIWPVKGKVLNTFAVNHKGINIAGGTGEPVFASAAGKVVYAGDGLRGYGNLIILKHNSVYLSAYAHNRQLLVAEGQWVQQGQKIAEMGNSGTNRTMLHFEIRQAGKPINPMKLLS